MANLNKEQAEAVRHKDGPCLCLAGPGSGKTHVLVERIKYLIEEEGIDPRTILVITFSKKAALHMKYRFENSTGNRNYPVCFGTFHAIFYNIVKDYYGLNEESVLTDCYKKLILEKVIKKLNIGELSEEFKASILFNVIACKYDLLLSYKVKSVDEYTENVYSDAKDRNNFAVIYNEYISECKRYRKIDFDDMLYMCRNLLINNKEILAKYQKLYRYILVDEFQDINEVQYEVLDMLAGDNNNVFAVGDDDQSIYGFRGSDPGFMKRFIDENEGTKIINLYKNYRCAKCIVEAAEKLITNNRNRLDKRQKACKKNKEEGFVTIKSFGNENDEAEYVIEEIKKMYSGETSDFAILYRTSKCADALEEKLKLSGINYLRKSDKNSYYDEEWIQDIISYFRVALGDINNKYLFRILNRPNRNILRDDEEKINNLMSKIKVLENMSGYAALMYVLKALEYEKYFYYINECKEIGLNESQKMLKELIMKSKQYYSLRTWIETIDDVYMKKKPSRNETIECSMNYENGNKDNKSNAKIELMTVHASKGLEFDTVFIIGLQEGIFPHRKAISTEEIEEERRLLYVAMTRAKNNLYIIGRGHESHGKRVSAFVSEISEKYSSKEGDFEV